MPRSKTFKILAGIVAAIGFVMGTSAFASNPAADSLVTTMFDVSSGLPQASVKDILQSRDGYLWVATQEGLARFDGVKFTVFTTRNAPGLVSNNLHQLLEDSAGNIWILAGSGVTRYRDGVFENLTPDCDRTGDRINYIFKSPDGKIYAASDSQFLMATPSGLVGLANTKGFLTRGPWYFAQQSDGTLWVGAGERHLISVHGSTVHRYVVPGNPGDEFGGLAVDAADTLWIGGRGLWQSKSGVLTPYRVAGQWSTQHIDALSGTKDGTLWFTIRGVVYSLAAGMASPKSWASPKATVRWTAFDDDGTIWQLLFEKGHQAIWSFQKGRTAQFDVPGNVTTEWTLPIRRGSEGNIWVGTYSGLAEIRKGRCRTYAADAGVPGGDVKALYQTRHGDIWLDVAGTTFGSLNNGKFAPSTDPNLRTADVSSIADDADDTLWVSTYNNHLWKRTGSGPAVDVRAIVDKATDPITALARGLDGSLWCADGTQLTQLVHGRKIASYPIRLDSSLADHIYVIKPAPDGRIWLGGEKGFACLANGKITYFGAEAGIPSVPIIDICRDHTGDIWLAFWGSGLARYRDGHVDIVTIRDGLYSDSIQSVMEGGEDLWMGTSNGIFTVKLSALDNYIDHRKTGASFSYRAYSSEDGADADQCEAGRQPVAFHAIDGSWWFACGHGVVSVSATAPVFRRDRPMPVWIEGAVIDRQDFETNRVADAKAGEGNLEFDYTAVTFHDAHKVTFRYRLEGFDQGWVDAAARRVAYYTHVPPGHYHFRVIASDAYGNQNTAGATFDFTLKPHYYETTWFRVLCFLMLLALTSGVGILHSYQLQRRNKILEERVLERTRDLEEANGELSASRADAVAQNEILQSVQAELEAQNQELVDSRALLAMQNEQLHEMKGDLELKNQSLADANDRLEDLATIDGLTGLKNHRSFQVKLDSEIKFAARHNTPLSVIILDVDSFKTFNDTYGHPAGDEVLKQVARILSETARDTDFVARYGGEEFVIILPVTDVEAALGVAERFRSAIETWPWMVRQITASFGVAGLSLDIDSAAEFVDRADQALYFSKKSGKNRVTPFNALTISRT